MISQRSKRNKAIFNGCKKIAFTHRRLLLIPLLGTIINTAIMYMFAHPWIEHETERLQTAQAPFFHYVGFYVAVMAFLYCRNAVNALLHGALTLSIQNALHSPNLTTWDAIKMACKRSKQIWSWVTFMCTLANFYKIYSTLIAHRHERKAFGGSYFHYAGVIAQIDVLYNNNSPIARLKHCGQLVTQRWGAPPLRQGFSIVAPLAMLGLFCLIPAMIGLLVFELNAIWLKVAIACSAALILLYFSVEKFISQILHWVIYDYCLSANISSGFRQQDLDKVFTPFLIEE